MAETYVRCIVVETETEIPGLALIQLHDDQPPVHYVPLDDLIELTELRRDVAGQNDDGSLNGEDYIETRLVPDWGPVDAAS